MILLVSWRLSLAQSSAPGASLSARLLATWPRQLPSAFAAKWAAVVGYQVRVCCVSAGPAQFAVSVPEGQALLRGGQRGGECVSG